MTEALMISQAILWVAVVALALLVWALTRQVGLLHERLAPLGALTMSGGAEIGETAPVLEGRRLTGAPIRIDATELGGRSLLLLFVSADCPLCKKILGLLASFAEAERDRVETVVVSEGSADEGRELIDRFGLARVQFALAAMVGGIFGVGKLPYGILIDEHGTVRAKGLVNTREHLESLVVADEIGVPSINAYLHLDEETDEAEKARDAAG